MADLLRDCARGTARLSPILLPGFVGVWAYSETGRLDWLGTGESFGGFLTLVLLLFPTAAIFGLLVQALRFVTFDLVRGLVRDQDIDADSPDATRYALYANLATFWAALCLGILIGRWGAWWDHPGRGAGYLLLFVLIELGLVAGAMRAFDQALAKPASRKTRTRKKA